ncbi:MAG: hypothetical protein Phyf2KO_26340 [Phycisphaerales bacterium]
MGHTIARGAGVMVGVSLLGKVLATISQFLLAGLLLKTEFGYVALTIAVADTVGIVQKIGLREMLMHRQASLADWINPAMWAAAVGGLATLLLLLAVAPIMPWLFDSSRELIELTAVASVGSGVFGFILVLEAVLAIQLRFKTIGAIKTGEMFTRITLQIVLAFMGFGAMSIILPRTLTWIFHAISLIIIVKPKVLRRPELNKWREALPDSTNLFMVISSQVAVRQGDYFLLGLFAADAVVGAYYFAFNLSTQAMMLVAQSLTSVLASGLGKLKSDINRQVEAFLRAQELISFVAVPMLVLQVISAGPLLTGLYGDKWELAVVPLQILSIAACWTAVGWNCHAMFAATGRFRQQRIVVISGMVGFVVLICLCAWLGDSVTVAIGVLAFRAVFIPIQIAVAAYGRVAVALKSVVYMLGPLVVAAIASVPAVLAGAIVRDEIAPAIGESFRGSSLESFVGANGMRGAMIVQVLLMSAVVAVLYNLLARLMLRETFSRFSSRMRAVLPARVLKLVPSWVF